MLSAMCVKVQKKILDISIFTVNSMKTNLILNLDTIEILILMTKQNILMRSLVIYQFISNYKNQILTKLV